MKLIEIKNSKGNYTYKVGGKKVGKKAALETLMENAMETVNAEVDKIMADEGIVEGKIEVDFKGLVHLEGFDSKSIKVIRHVDTKENAKKLVVEIMSKFGTPLRRHLMKANHPNLFDAIIWLSDNDYIPCDMDEFHGLVIKEVA